MISERITVKEIARLAGVSIGTVDRVLHDRGGVSTETKEKIGEIIESMGYRPDLVARQLSLNKAYTLRAILPRADQDSGYWSLCLAGLRRVERELFAPYRARLRIDEFDRYDSGAFLRLLDDVVREPGDGLLFAPVLPNELLAALERLSSRGGATPYAFFDCEVPGASPVASVIQDPERGGRLAGRLMSLLAPSSGRFVALSAHAGDRHIAHRIDGFRAYFAQAEGPAREIESYECRDLESPHDRDGFLSDLFAGRSDIAGVLVANSSGHFVGDWLAERGLKAGLALVSWDLVPANARALREGRIDCVLSQRPAEQAREALTRLFKSVVEGPAPAEGGAGELETPIPLDVYFKENIPSGAEAGDGPAFRERSGR